MKAALIWGVPLIVLICCAIGLALISTFEFTRLRAYADGIASDGMAESFSRRVYGEMIGRARWLAGLCAVSALIWGLLRKSMLAFVSGLSAERAKFRKDSAKTARKLKKFTSRSHKKAVFGIIIIGGLLRVFFLFEPITYDEAFTYAHYVSKPLSVVLSDYSYPNNHIFHNMLAWVLTSVFGPSPVVLRFPALFFGLLTMPLVYLFTRAMFNRYVALITLAFVATAGGFVEYSALARGYSITWVCFIVCLMLGRYSIKKNNLYVLLVMAVVNAVGLWAVPVMIYPAMAIYVWIFFGIAIKYNRSLNERLYKVLLSIGVMLGLAGLLYIPVILTYGVGQLFVHPTMGDTSWSYFMEHDQDQLYSVWVYVAQTSTAWVTITLLTCALFALVISSKYRMMMIGAVVAIVPLVLFQSVIGPPRIWNFALLWLYISGGIGIFYFLKFIQSKIFSNLGKRLRTVAASILIVFGCGFLSFQGIPDRIFRMHEAHTLGSYFNTVLEDGERVFVAFPIEAQVEYQFHYWDIDLTHLSQEPATGANVYVLVNEKKEQTVEGVLETLSEPELFTEPELLEQKGNTSIYRTRLK